MKNPPNKAALLVDATLLFLCVAAIVLMVFHATLLVWWMISPDHVPLVSGDRDAIRSLGFILLNYCAMRLCVRVMAAREAKR